MTHRWIMNLFTYMFLAVLMHSTHAVIDECINGTTFDNLFSQCSAGTVNSIKGKPLNGLLVCDTWDDLVKCSKDSIAHCGEEAVVGEVLEEGKLVVGSQVYKKDILYLLAGLQKSADYLCLQNHAKVNLLLKYENFKCALDSYGNFSDEDAVKYNIDSSVENTEIFLTVDGSDSTGLFDQFEFDDISVNGMDSEVCADLRYKKQRLANWLEKGNCNYDEVILNVGEALETFFNEVCTAASSATVSAGSLTFTVLCVMVGAWRGSAVWR